MEHASKGLLFVAVFGIFEGNLSFAKQGASKLLWMTYDALLFVQLKYHYIVAKMSDLVGRACSLTYRHRTYFGFVLSSSYIPFERLAVGREGWAKTRVEV